MAELRGILRAYPSIHCQLFYADYDLHGPYKLKADGDLPQPRGGGGTSFVPFFDAVGKCAAAERPYLCVYLTDGYGEFPETAPEVPTLWVVTSGGLERSGFPFGNVVQLLSS